MRAAVQYVAKGHKQTSAVAAAEVRPASFGMAGF